MHACPRTPPRHLTPPLGVLVAGEDAALLGLQPAHHRQPRGVLPGLRQPHAADPSPGAERERQVPLLAATLAVPLPAVVTFAGRLVAAVPFLQRRHGLLVAPHHAPHSGAAALAAHVLELLAAPHPQPDAPPERAEPVAHAAGELPVEDLPARLQRALLDLPIAPQVPQPLPLEPALADGHSCQRRQAQRRGSGDGDELGHLSARITDKSLSLVV